mgnify:CR=1 FL=1
MLLPDKVNGKFNTAEKEREEIAKKADKRSNAFNEHADRVQKKSDKLDEKYTNAIRRVNKASIKAGKSGDYKKEDSLLKLRENLEE